MFETRNFTDLDEKKKERKVAKGNTNREFFYLKVYLQSKILNVA